MKHLSKFHEFIPKSYLYLSKGYSFSTFKKDLLAGLTVGMIAIPLAMAFAIASGVSPEKGLYTAIIAGFLISALGGSRVQIGGPTGAFVVIIYGIIQRTGYNGLCLSLLVASFILVLLGLFRIGSWIKYIPYPLITGFTSGIAVLIFSTQMKDFFGFQMGNPPVDFIEKWTSYYTYFSTFNPLTLLVSSATLLFIIGIRYFMPRLPWGVLAIFLATAICSLFHLPVETIQSRFGELSLGFPIPSWPSFKVPGGAMKEIVFDGFTIAFLGALESLLSSVIGDGMIGGRHRSNCELVAQGIANFGSLLFGGIPATGALARTAANVKAGGQTPVAGMIHALFLLLVVCFLSPLVSQIPLASLSAILIVVAWNMSEVEHFIHFFKAPLGDLSILLIAFFLTIFVDITVAISVGMIFASFIFMKRMSQLSKVVPLSGIFDEDFADFPEINDPENISKKIVPQGVEVFEIQGPFFFGAANLLKDLLNGCIQQPKAFILRMRQVPMVDASGMYALQEFYEECKKKQIQLLLSGVRGQTAIDLEKFGLIDTIGRDRVFFCIDEALGYLRDFTS